MIRFTARNWTEEGLARRIGLMVNGVDEKWYDKELGRWQIGGGNNFWLRRIGENQYGFSYRYATEDKAQALRVMFEWLLGVQIESV